MPRGKAKPWINKKNAVTFQLVSRGFSDLLAGDADAPQNVLQQIPSASDRAASRAAEQSDENDDEFDEEYDDMDMEEISEEEIDAGSEDDEDNAETYDYSQHMKQVGSGVGFSVFVHRNGTIVPTATMNKSEEPEKSDDRLRIDPKSLKAMSQRQAPKAEKKDVAERLGLDKSLFAMRSELAEEEGKFMRRFGHLGEDQFVDPEVLQELEKAMEEADDASEGALPDNFVALANDSESEEDDNFENNYDEADNGGGLDIDIDEDITPVRRPKSKSSAPVQREPLSEEMKFLHEKFKREMDEFDKDDSESDDDRDPSQFRGAADIGAFEDVLDDFLEQQSKTLLDGFQRDPSTGAHAVRAKRPVFEEENSEDEEEEEDEEYEEDDHADKLVDSAEDMEVIVVPVQDRYGQDDCESVLSSYTNTENHPRLLDERPKIQLTSRGMPKGFMPPAARPPPAAKKPKALVPITRTKDETPEEKKARKNATKTARREQRQKKKELKVAYKQEESIQKKVNAAPQRNATIVHYS